MRTRLVVLLCCGCWLFSGGGTLMVAQEGQTCPCVIEEGDWVYFCLNKLHAKTPPVGVEPFFVLKCKDDSAPKKARETKNKTDTVGGYLKGRTGLTENFELGLHAEVSQFELQVYSSYWDDPLDKCSFTLDQILNEFQKAEQSPYEGSKPTIVLRADGGSTFVLALVDKEDQTYTWFRVDAYELKNLPKEFMAVLEARQRKPHNAQLSVSQDSCDSLMTLEFQIQFDLNPPVPPELQMQFDDDLSVSLPPLPPLLDDDQDFLLRNTPGDSVEFLISQVDGRKCILARANVRVSDIFDKIKVKMQAYPQDPDKWVIPINASNGCQLYLQFRGVRRLYSFESIGVPEGSPLRKGKKKPPRVVAWVQEGDVVLSDGDRDFAALCGAVTGERKWEGRVPDDENCRFEIREGLSRIYSIHVEGRNRVWGSETLATLTPVYDRDFRADTASQKINNSEVRVTFKRVQPEGCK